MQPLGRTRGSRPEASRLVAGRSVRVEPALERLPAFAASIGLRATSAPCRRRPAVADWVSRPPIWRPTVHGFICNSSISPGIGRLFDLTSEKSGSQFRLVQRGSELRSRAVLRLVCRTCNEEGFAACFHVAVPRFTLEPSSRQIRFVAASLSWSNLMNEAQDHPEIDGSEIISANVEHFPVPKWAIYEENPYWLSIRNWRLAWLVAAIAIAAAIYLGVFRGEWRPTGDGKSVVHSRTGEIRVVSPSAAQSSP